MEAPAFRRPAPPTRLDSLADRLMFRLAYRNFGTHESLVVNHSVAVTSGGGVRWYEIQNPSGTPTVAQQGTYAPDSTYRWMGSVAMDKSGDLAVGYSKSSSSAEPVHCIRWTCPYRSSRHPGSRDRSGRWNGLADRYPNSLG